MLVLFLDILILVLILVLVLFLNIPILILDWYPPHICLLLRYLCPSSLPFPDFHSRPHLNSSSHPHPWYRRAIHLFFCLSSLIILVLILHIFVLRLNIFVLILDILSSSFFLFLSSPSHCPGSRHLPPTMQRPRWQRTGATPRSRSSSSPTCGPSPTSPSAARRWARCSSPPPSRPGRTTSWSGAWGSTRRDWTRSRRTTSPSTSSLCPATKVKSEQSSNSAFSTPSGRRQKRWKVREHTGDDVNKSCQDISTKLYVFSCHFKLISYFFLFRFVQGKDWGFKKFIRRDFLLDEANGQSES